MQKRNVETEAVYIAAVQEGLADIEAGRHRCLEEVTEEWVERGMISPNWRDEPAEDEE